jgi:hypothetical protein
MATIINSGKFEASDGDGVPYAGGELYTYLAGSAGATPKATYSDAKITTPNANPVVLDADGRADVWVGGGSYLLILKDSLGNTVWSVDDYLDEIGGVILFDTVALMKAESLAVGETVMTRGYYTKGDGGGATYLIVAPQAFDGYGDHDLANGNIAVLQAAEIIRCEQYGVGASQAAATNILAMTAALGAAASLNGSKVTLTIPGTYAANALITLNETYNNTTIHFGDGVIWDVDGASGSFSLDGTVNATTTTDTNIAAGDFVVPVASTTGMSVGDKVWIYHTTPTGQCDAGVIESISAGISVTLKQPVRYSWVTAEGISVVAVSACENIIFEGNGTIQNLTAINSSNLVTFYNSWNCHIRDLHVGQRQGTSRPVLFSSGTGPKVSAFCSAERVTVNEASENGIESYLTSFGNEMRSNIVLNAGAYSADGHCYSVRGSGHRIHGNIGKKCTGDGISVGSCRDITISNNQLSGANVTDKAGIALTTGNIRGVTVTGNTCNGNYWGIRAYDATPSGEEKITITGNNLRGNIQGPISSGVDMDITCKGNVPTIETSKSLTASTGGAVETDLYTHTIPAYSLGAYGGGFNVKASLYVTGAAGAKTIKLKFGGSTIITSLQQFDEAGSHTIDCTIKNINALNSNKASWITFVSTAGIESHDRNGIAIDTAVDQDIVITGQCANAADSVVLEDFTVTPLGVAL